VTDDPPYPTLEGSFHEVPIGAFQQIDPEVVQKFLSTDNAIHDQPPAEGVYNVANICRCPQLEVLNHTHFMYHPYAGPAALVGQLVRKLYPALFEIFHPKQKNEYVAFNRHLCKKICNMRIRGTAAALVSEYNHVVGWDLEPSRVSQYFRNSLICDIKTCGAAPQVRASHKMKNSVLCMMAGVESYEVHLICKGSGDFRKVEFMKSDSLVSEFEQRLEDVLEAIQFGEACEGVKRSWLCDTCKYGRPGGCPIWGAG